MNIRNLAASLTLAAGSLLFVAQPALHAQDYSYSGYEAPRYYYRVSTRQAIQHDRRELDRALARGDYATAHREIREIRQRRNRLARARRYQYRRPYLYDPYSR